MSEPELFSQDFELGFTYTRSTGPIVGEFLTQLRDRKIVGTRGSDGGVIVPPMEFDPVSAEALTEFVEVGQAGEVKTWSWVKNPNERQPLNKPFAWAMILLDGASTPMLHAVDAGSEDAMSSGMRVQVRWVEETRGSITDIAAFEPVGGE